MTARGGVVRDAEGRDLQGEPEPSPPPPEVGPLTQVSGGGVRVLDSTAEAQPGSGARHSGRDGPLPPGGLRARRDSREASCRSSPAGAPRIPELSSTRSPPTELRHIRENHTTEGSDFGVCFSPESKQIKTESTLNARLLPEYQERASQAPPWDSPALLLSGTAGV